MDYLGERPVTTITVQIFPAHRATHFDYYDDDGDTYAYQYGHYFLQRLSAQATAHAIRLRTAAPRGTYKPALRRFRFAVQRVRAQALSVDGHAVLPAATPAALSACTTVCWARGHTRFGDVTYIDMPAAKATRVRIEEAGG